jgi:hypothetical protein
MKFLARLSLKRERAVLLNRLESQLGQKQTLAKALPYVC